MARETPAERRKRAGRIARRLARAYPDVEIALHFRSPWELLVATILSAQCTDKKVNEVTPELFRRYPAPRDLAAAPLPELERLVHATGFYRQKARSLRAAARALVEGFGGEVPDSLEELTTLPGVARKTANVVIGNAFGAPGLAIDTHMKRVNTRLGLTRETDPVKIERDLMELLPRREWTAYSLRGIHHGRVCCRARKPDCDTCPLRPECPWPDSAEARAQRK